MPRNHISDIFCTHTTTKSIPILICLDLSVTFQEKSEKRDIMGSPKYCLPLIHF